ncbi:MAG: STAS domain-containing protein [Oscillochloridaceae bacterium umkhey_bin13]
MERWLAVGPVRDPIEHQQAPALQWVFLSLVLGALAACVVFLLALGLTPAGLLLAVAALEVALTSGLSIVILRHGHFKPAAMTSAGGLLLGLGIVILPYGYPAAIPFILVVLLPVILLGLVAEPRQMLITAGGGALITILALVLMPLMSPVRVLVAPTSDLSLLALGLFLIVLAVATVMLWLFGPRLRAALQAAMSREQELNQLRAGLEQTVAERTAALAEALQTVQQREAQTRQALDALQTSQAAIRELSAPILPVLPGVLVAPLIGAIDSARASTFTANVLRAAEQQRARQIVFDITGVPVVDTHVAGILLQTATAARMLGAHVMLVGVRPEVAQTLVGLGVALDQIETHADLQQALSRLKEVV